MNQEYADLSFPQREWHPEAYPFGSGADWYGSPFDAQHSGPLLEPPDTGWDPVEEMAYLLQDAVAGERATSVPPPRSESPSGVLLRGTGRLKSANFDSSGCRPAAL